MRCLPVALAVGLFPLPPPGETCADGTALLLPPLLLLLAMLLPVPFSPAADMGALGRAGRAWLNVVLVLLAGSLGTPHWL
jgi:hypothetical protein